MLINDVESIKNYLIGVTDFIDVSWMEKLGMLGVFIKVNTRRPSISSKDEKEKGLGIWLYNLTQNGKKRSVNMVDEKISNVWDDFKLNHIEHFLTNEVTWYKKLEEVKMLMEKNKTRRLKKAKDKNEKVLGQWI